MMSKTRVPSNGQNARTVQDEGKLRLSVGGVFEASSKAPLAFPMTPAFQAGWQQPHPGDEAGSLQDTLNGETKLAFVFLLAHDGRVS